MIEKFYHDINACNNVYDQLIEKYLVNRCVLRPDLDKVTESMS